MQDREAQHWIVTGRLLQRKGNSFYRRIAKRDGETYPQAVQRVLQDELSAAERQYLEDLVDWLEDFESHDLDTTDLKRKERNNAG